MKDLLLVDQCGVPLNATITAANVNAHLALPDLLTNPIIVRQPAATSRSLDNRSSESDGLR